MSFFSNSRADLLSEAILDPEEGWPAILLTFSVPAGRICIITTSLPTLPKRTRERLLKAYASTAVSTKAETILIGGAFADAVIFMENQMTRLDVDFEICSNENLCLFAHSSDSTSAQCVALDTRGPFSFMAVVDGTKNQPDRLSLDTDTNSAQSSAERRAADHGSAERPAPRPGVRLRPFAPLYDGLIANLEQAAGQHPEGHAFINYITNSCFCGKLLTTDLFGEPLEKPMPLAVKMEDLLHAARRQRQHQIDWLRRSSSCRRRVHMNMHMDGDDMKHIYNEWGDRPQEWMHKASFEEYTSLIRTGQNQKAHQFRRSRFSTSLSTERVQVLVA